MSLVVQVPKQPISYTPELQMASGSLLLTPRQTPAPSSLVNCISAGSRGSPQIEYDLNGLFVCQTLFDCHWILRYKDEDLCLRNI